MTFRKDSLLFYQSEIFYIVMAIVCLAFIPILGLQVSLLCMLPFVVLIMVNPKLHSEYITINEIGVSCQKLGRQIWAYDWDSIAELKRGSRFLMPSIEVITYNRYGEPEQISASNHYFQSGRAAKEAIEQYYKPVSQNQ